MSTAYAIGFIGERFVMVHNPHRGGWEMPGGHVEPGEDPIDAAIREFQEEAGLDIEPLGSMEMGDVTVVAGIVIRDLGQGEMAKAIFHELPSDLSFPREEYGTVIAWARSVIEAHSGEI